MSQPKLRVGVLFGGKSAEHEISLISAKNVIDAIDKQKYEVVLIAIDKNGEWHIKNGSEFLEDANDSKRIRLSNDKQPIALIPKTERKEIVSYLGNQLQEPLKLDVIWVDKNCVSNVMLIKPGPATTISLIIGCPEDV